MSSDRFIEVTEPHVEWQRRRALLKSHPEVKRLMGRNPWSALFIVALVAAQLASALALSAYGVHWAIVVGLAYVTGATVSHALYVLIHEATHNLIVKNEAGNRLLGILCDFALFAPGSMAFRKYHLLHHRFGGVKDLDADICHDWEARIVRNIAWRKVVWLLLFMFSQASRPMKVVGVPLWDRWVIADMAVVAVVDLAILYYGGNMAALYLGLSTFFGLGLHPLGGRWIQEHYITKDGQETYSYYGPLNRVSLTSAITTSTTT